MRYALLALTLLLPACYYDRVTGSWYRANVRWGPPNIDFADYDPNSMEHRLAIQGYMRTHNGKMPPPDAYGNP